MLTARLSLDAKNSKLIYSGMRAEPHMPKPTPQYWMASGPLVTWKRKEFK